MGRLRQRARVGQLEMIHEHRWTHNPLPCTNVCTANASQAWTLSTHAPCVRIAPGTTKKVPSLLRQRRLVHTRKRESLPCGRDRRFEYADGCSRGWRCAHLGVGDLTLLNAAASGNLLGRRLAASRQKHVVARGVTAHERALLLGTRIRVGPGKHGISRPQEGNCASQARRCEKCETTMKARHDEKCEATMNSVMRSP